MWGSGRAVQVITGPGFGRTFNSPTAAMLAATAAQRLKLGYRRHAEGTCGYDAVIVDWRPGMKTPVAHKSSNEHTDETLVLASAVKEATVLLEGGNIQQGIDALKHLCPDIPDLPPFEIV